jgi:hypothetical protein
MDQARGQPIASPGSGGGGGGAAASQQSAGAFHASSGAGGTPLGFRRGSTESEQSPMERSSSATSSKQQLQTAGDPLDDESRRLLMVPPAQRNPTLLEQLVQLTGKLAGEYFDSLSERQHYALARSWRYQYFAPGMQICVAEEPCREFHIVLEGSCELTERQVHHLEGGAGSDGFRRVVDCRRGRAFGHYPLVVGDSKYDYYARVRPDAPGCSMLLVPKASYVQVCARRPALASKRERERERRDGETERRRDGETERG